MRGDRRKARRRGGPAASARLGRERHGRVKVLQRERGPPGLQVHVAQVAVRGRAGAVLGQHDLRARGLCEAVPRCLPAAPFPVLAATIQVTDT